MDSGDNNAFNFNIEVKPKSGPVSRQAKPKAKPEVPAVVEEIVPETKSVSKPTSTSVKPSALKPNMGRPVAKKEPIAKADQAAPVPNSDKTKIAAATAGASVVVVVAKNSESGEFSINTAKTAVVTPKVQKAAAAKEAATAGVAVTAVPTKATTIEKTVNGKAAGAPTATGKATTGKGTTGKGTDKSKKADGDSTEEAAPVPGRKFLLFTAVPSWLISMLLHTVLILTLALITFADSNKATSILTVASPAEEVGESEIQQFDLQDTEPPAVETSEEVEPPVDTPPPMASVTPVAIQTPLETTMMSADMMDFSMQEISSESLTKSLSQSQSKSLNSRSKDMKKELLKKYGGSDASEAAVARALKWISLHQAPNGGWTFEHHLVCGRACGEPGERTKAYNAATAFAILPFLGAGQTHLQGEYKGVVKKGLMFLISQMKVENKGGLVTGSLMEGEGNMYSHGLAAIAICEAYAMTEDPDLLQPAQAVINHIIYAQDPVKGGWRYSPRSDSDTSVVGWQLMALKSGYMAHLQIPPTTFRGAVNFLDFASTSQGAYYGYDGPSLGKPPVTTAVGLLCRMYMGWDRASSGLGEGVKFIASNGVNKQNMYYNYYAAQVLRQYGGPDWDKFNVEIRDWLVENQVSKGHATGSWYFPDAAAHSGPKEGGRLAATSLSTMILEVYYRHMPLYADAAAADDFPL